MCPGIGWQETADLQQLAVVDAWATCSDDWECHGPCFWNVWRLQVSAPQPFESLTMFAGVSRVGAPLSDTESQIYMTILQCQSHCRGCEQSRCATLVSNLHDNEHCNVRVSIDALTKDHRSTQLGSSSCLWWCDYMQQINEHLLIWLWFARSANDIANV